MSEKKDREHLQDLLALEKGLANWEVEFIESLNHWEGEFTDSQREVLYQIYERRC